MNDIVTTLTQTFHLQDVQDSHPIKRACAEILRLREEAERMRLLAVEAQRRCDKMRAALAAEQPAPSEPVVSGDDLPPLPVGGRDHGANGPFDWWDAQHMRDYARAAVAAERKRMADELLRWQRDEREHADGSEYASGRLAGLHDATLWVRAQGAAK